MFTDATGVIAPFFLSLALVVVSFFLVVLVSISLLCPFWIFSISLMYC